jgi:hypothetical protein
VVGHDLSGVVTEAGEGEEGEGALIAGRGLEEEEEAAERRWRETEQGETGGGLFGGKGYGEDEDDQ